MRDELSNCVSNNRQQTTMDTRVCWLVYYVALRSSVTWMTALKNVPAPTNRQVLFVHRSKWLTAWWLLIRSASSTASASSRAAPTPPPATHTHTHAYVRTHVHNIGGSSGGGSCVRNTHAHTHAHTVRASHDVNQHASLVENHLLETFVSVDRSSDRT